MFILPTYLPVVTPVAHLHVSSVSKVSRVLIEASTHRVHLLKSNTLTFDSTGSGRPLAAIAANIARYLKVPYVRVDCSQLVSSKTQERCKQEHE